MGSIHTYDDFLKAVEEKGLKNSFSDADMALAKTNPDAGMSILNYKLDWLNAKTDEARALANQGAESVRSRYGNYTSGSGGSGFYLPGAFSYEDAPSYSDSYGERYREQLDQLVNREAFSYDADNDALYSQYRKAYTREGQRATADALAQASAASGGIPSSYANTAANQAGNYYASQLTDKIPELYRAAYQRYLGDHDLQQSDLAALRTASQDAYSRYLDQLDQYNNERGSAYQQYLDAIDRQTAQEQREKSWARTMAYYNDYSGLANLGVDISAAEADRADAVYQRELSNALNAFELSGDTSALEALGVDVSQLLAEQELQREDREYELRQRSLNEAITIYQATGDYSALEALGIDVSHIRQQLQNEQYEYELATAVTAADYGDYTRLYALGISPNMLNVYRAMLAGSKYYVGEVWFG